jgi:hypothetical protein
MGPYVLYECMLLVLRVVFVFQWMKWDVSNFGPFIYMLLCGRMLLVLMAMCNPAWVVCLKKIKNILGNSCMLFLYFCVCTESF